MHCGTTGNGGAEASKAQVRSHTLLQPDRPGAVTKLKVCGNLNPATFLPEKENETPDHDCTIIRDLI